LYSGVYTVRIPAETPIILRYFVLYLSHTSQGTLLAGSTLRSGVPRNFVRWGGGVQQIRLRTEDRENGDLGAVAP